MPGEHAHQVAPTISRIPIVSALFRAASMLLVVVAVAAAVAHTGAACTTSADCFMNGDCSNGACACALPVGCPGSAAVGPGLRSLQFFCVCFVVSLGAWTLAVGRPPVQPAAV
jgi:hypothetical protein